MGKISNVLYMIDLLNTGNVYSLKELSERIGVSERMVRYYKEEIINNGILIESFKGPNGGYFMIDKIKNYTSVNKYDIQLLDNIYNVLNKIDFQYLDKYKIFLDKAKKMHSICNEKSKFLIPIEDYCTNELMKIIEDAVVKSDTVKIKYNDLTGEVSNRIIHPLYIFKYNNKHYVTAYCELRDDIRHFEIDRIEKIK